MDGVVLLHGIFLPKLVMHGLSTYLERSGYRVLNVGYPSTKHSIEDLAETIHPQVADFMASVDGKVHFVGFSMGGLLIRAYLKNHMPERLGRVVMIGTPNNGSEVADLLKNFPPYRRYYGPAGQQLTTDQTGFSDIFSANVNYEVGIIAGNKSDPISSRIIGQPNDGKVSVESTMLEGAVDHIVVPSGHTLLPYRKQVWQQVGAFLREGKFTAVPSVGAVPSR
jgi:pimeloyl-ACP methyl ester carboxylesterase